MRKILSVTVFLVSMSVDAAAACTDEAYVAFLRTYLPKVYKAEGRAALEAVTKSVGPTPCAATDKGYLALWQQWHKRWTQALSDESLSEEELGLLNAMAAARPTGTTGASFAKWAELFDRHYRPMLNPVLTQNRIVEPAYTFNAAEGRMLTALDRMRPTSDDVPGYVTWLKLYQKYVDRILTSVAYQNDKRLSVGMKDALSKLEAFRPKGQGEKAYLAWLKPYVDLLQKAARTGLEPHRTRLDLMLAAKTCGASPKTNEIYARVRKLRGPLAKEASYVDQAAPDCR